jgi:hypothetical protein
MPNKSKQILAGFSFLLLFFLIGSPLVGLSTARTKAITVPESNMFFAFPVTERKGVRQSDGSIIFHCSTKTWSRLRLPENNEAIAAKRASYHFQNIQWRAGQGWPTYSTRCPRSDKVSNDVYPNSLHHMLIVQFGGDHWDECSNSNTGTGNEITEIFVGANDDLLGDNMGGFDLVITGYSKD